MSARDIVTRIVITAKDQASGVFTGLRTKVAAVGAAIAAYFGVNAFVDGIKGAAEFQEQMSKVQAITGASADEMDQLRKAAEDAGATTRYTATEAGQALENLARSGLTATESIQTLPAVLALAQGNSLELGEAAAFITKAVAGMGLEFDQAGRVADVLAKAAASANTDVQGLGQALSYAAPTANSLGLSLEETVAIIGKFADAGIDAGRAGTALNSIMAQFSDPASKFRRELGAAGITTNDFNKALRQLGEAGPKGQGAILAVGQEAGPALRALLGQGIGALDELRNSLLNAEGAAAKAAGVMDSNLNGALRALGSAWDTLKNTLLTPLLDPLAQQFTGLADRIRGFVADGTVDRFAQVLKDAFENSAGAFNQFLAGFNLESLIARIQLFAQQAGATLATVTGYLSNARDVSAVVFGAIGTGIDAIKIAFYGLSTVVAQTVSSILSGYASLVEGFSKVTFGDVSAQFKASADAIREYAESFAASARENADKAKQALMDTASSAQDLRGAFADLTGAADAQAASLNRAAAATDTLGKKATLTADQLDALGDDFEFVGGEARRAVDAVNMTSVALGKTGTAASAAARDVLKVPEAFKRMGVQSKSELDKLAAEAKSDFETIRASGAANTEGLTQAFTTYAQAAVAANNGVADAALMTQATMMGLKVTVDEAGNVTVTSMNNAAEAMKRARIEAERLRGAVRGVGKDAGQASAQIDKAGDSAAAAGKKATEVRASFAEPFLKGAAAASKYAAAAQRLGAEIYESTIGKIRVATLRTWSQALNTAYALAHRKAVNYTKALDDLDRQQQRVNNSVRDGYEDMKLRLLELDGTEEEVAAARAAREKAQVEREIALLKIEEKRARKLGELEKAEMLASDIQVTREKLTLLDQIHAKEAAQAKARRAEERKRAEEEKREQKRTERERDEVREEPRERPAAAEASPAATSGQASPATTRHEFVLRAGNGPATTVRVEGDADAAAFGRFLSQLADDMGRAA